MSGNVADRYAKAILELGAESGTLDQLVSEITTLAEAYASSAELQNTLENPLVSIQVKQAIVADLVAAAGASTLTKNALALLMSRRRLPMLGAISSQLRALHDEKAGVVHAHVTTAARLDEEQHGKLQHKLEAMTGKKVKIERHEDHSLLGGMVIRIGDTMVDGSVKGRLEAMRRDLMLN